MKCSTTLLVFFALCAVAFGASTNHHTKSRSIKNAFAQKKSIEQVKQDKFIAKSNHEEFFATASAKAAIDSAAESLKSAIERIVPLAKNGAALSGEVYQRLLKGPSKEGRAADDKLTQKLSAFTNDARSAASDFFAAAKAAASSSFFAKAASTFAKAFAAFAA